MRCNLCHAVGHKHVVVLVYAGHVKLDIVRVWNDTVAKLTIHVDELLNADSTVASCMDRLVMFPAEDLSKNRCMAYLLIKLHMFHLPLQINSNPRANLDILPRRHLQLIHYPVPSQLGHWRKQPTQNSRWRRGGYGPQHGRP